jgi:hypothetical protein
MAEPKTGDTYRLAAEAGLGAAARDADPDLTGPLPTEQAVLDLAPGTTVVVAGHDDDRGLTLVEWVDGQGTSRITSVDPAALARDFERE